MRVSRLPAVAIVALTAAACEMAYGPTSPTGEWSVHDSSRYTLHARPGSFADANAAALIEVLEDQYTHTNAVFGFAEGPRISAFLYTHGGELTPPLPQARAGVAFPDTNALHAVAFAPLDDNLRTLITHEANHVIINGNLGRAGTSFMNEGLASALISERYGEIGRTFLYKWAARNRSRLLRIADVVEDGQWDSNSDSGYKTSAAFLAFLIDRYGTAKLRQVYYTPSADFARRAAEVYGKPLEALEAEWLAAI
jgi:hypothetical protein